MSETVSFHELPPYIRSLLRIKLPVTVTLARQTQSMADILRIGQGTLLQFEKPCEDLLDLEVAGHKIGLGEAVKVGDKFGLRVTSLRLPNERFSAVHPRK